MPALFTILATYSAMLTVIAIAWYLSPDEKGPHNA